MSKLTEKDQAHLNRISRLLAALRETLKQL